MRSTAQLTLLSLLLVLPLAGCAPDSPGDPGPHRITVYDNSSNHAAMEYRAQGAVVTSTTDKNEPEWHNLTFVDATTRKPRQLIAGKDFLVDIETL